MSDVAFDRGHYFLDVPGEHQFSHGQREAHGLRFIGMRRYRESIWIGDYINERRPRMLQRLLDARGQISGVFDSHSHDPDGFGKLREVWILEVGLKVWKSSGFHFELQDRKSTRLN